MHAHASHPSIPTEPIDQRDNISHLPRGTNTTPTMLAHSLLITLATILAVGSPASAATFDVKGRCPDKCVNNTEKLFRACAPLFSHGCEFSECQNRVYACRVMPKGPPFYELGEKVTISGAKIGEDVKLPLSLTSARPRVDIYFVLDATFTNKLLVKDAKTSYALFMQRVSAFGLDAAFGVGIFRDESELKNGFKNLQTISTDANMTAAALNQVEGMGGLDYFESNLVALYKTTVNGSVGWRPGARRIVVMAAAFVGHEPTCSKGLPRLTRGFVADALVNASVTPVFYSAPGDVMDAATVPYGCADAETVGKGQTSYIAKKAGGVFLKGASRKLDVDAVYSAVEGLLMNVSADESDCTGIAKVRFNTSFDKPFMNGDGVRIDVKLLPQLCQPVGNASAVVMAKCSVKFAFNGDGERKSKLSLDFDDIQGCDNSTDPKRT